MQTDYRYSVELGKTPQPDWLGIYPKSSFSSLKNLNISSARAYLFDKSLIKRDIATPDHLKKKLFFSDTSGTDTTQIPPITNRITVL